MVANVRDVLAGLFFVAVGVAVFLLSRGYGIGTPAHLGPGVFPMLLSGLLVALGIAIALVAVRDKVAAAVGLSWRPLLLVTAAVGVFGFGLDTLGLFASVALMVLVSRAARSGQSVMESLVMALVLGAAASFLFYYLLGLPVPLWPAFAA
ncbi:tripartite tricarboxylate transporter TctB family protein [Xanthobacter tagetidis]|uniref:Tripartite tricarboxylate transporter TctB family protein n=1 Tax=Xanthobacter tagetidis TaxID=60216 RepID=A0A3L7A211_9HYPH|nr:tripartite tricarboxylate transporter TctB family protein [Xanthobacter tagetidis]MBB6307200.1 hypothetical protein [Xanthobacter tagetidis]RLP74038.1 tripartite tricarboxylate transporter TctB family protein [Xanthobacter tagetidis]